MSNEVVPNRHRPVPRSARGWEGPRRDPFSARNLVKLREQRSPRRPVRRSGSSSL